MTLTGDQIVQIVQAVATAACLAAIVYFTRRDR